MNDKVSVIIPIYNSAQFLRESIESVITQTYSDLEIICIDDGSTDNSLDILKEYSNKIIIIHQENQGLAGALKTGINKMQGRWFKWFSPDDIMESFAIETLVCKAKSFGTNVILYSNWKIIDETGKILRNFHESNYNDLSIFDFNIRLLDGQQINVNTALIPSNVFSNGCRIKELYDPVAIDYDLFLQAGILFGVKFFLIDNFLVKYRIHEKQLSHTHIAKTLSYLQSVKDSILSELDIDTKNQYIDSLSKYKKNKPMTKKILDLGLKITLQLLPVKLADQIIVFYVNKLRHGR